MTHQFDIEVAEKYGVNEAILLHNIAFWIKKNQANDKHLHEGHYWTYNSMRAFAKLFPYFSQDQIKRLLKKLENEGAITKGNFNKIQYDRTNWYTIVDPWIMQKYLFDWAKSPNGVGEIAPPIPDSNTDSKQYNTQSKIASNKKPMYQEQTIELDESGEEIQSPRKKTTFGRYPGKIAKAYCELTGKRSASRQLPSAKELMQICQEDFPGKSMEEWYGEIIKRMQKLKEQYDKNDIKDWNLSKLAEHWELKKEEIKKDVADRRIL